MPKKSHRIEPESLSVEFRPDNAKTISSNRTRKFIGGRFDQIMPKQSPRIEPESLSVEGSTR